MQMSKERTRIGSAELRDCFWSAFRKERWRANSSRIAQADGEHWGALQLRTECELFRNADAASIGSSALTTRTHQRGFVGVRLVEWVHFARRANQFRRTPLTVCLAFRRCEASVHCAEFDHCSSALSSRFEANALCRSHARRSRMLAALRRCGRDRREVLLMFPVDAHRFRVTRFIYWPAARHWRRRSWFSDENRYGSAINFQTSRFHELLQNRKQWRDSRR